MASVVTAAFRAAFQKLWQQEKAMPYNELLMNLLTCMQKHGLLDEREICASKMLVHYKNKNGLMLSVVNAPANASTSQRVWHIEANSQIQCVLWWRRKVIAVLSTSTKSINHDGPLYHILNWD